MRRTSSMRERVVPPPAAERTTTGPESAHLLNCTTSFSTSVYDSSCPRCRVIKHVVFLRRKTVQGGAFVQEYLAASALANKLIQKHALTKGEVYDREYPLAEIPIVTRRRKPII